VRRAVYELYDLWAGRNRVEDVDLMSQEDIVAIVCVFWDALNVFPKSLSLISSIDVGMSDEKLQCCDVFEYLLTRSLNKITRK